MRKAEKRRIGEAKQAQNRLESKASGLLAQRQDQKAREKNYQEKLIARDEKEIRQSRKNGGSKKASTLSIADFPIDALTPDDLMGVIDMLAHQALAPAGRDGLARNETVNAARAAGKTTLDPELSRNETMTALAKKENR